MSLSRKRVSAPRKEDEPEFVDGGSAVSVKNFGKVHRSGLAGNRGIRGAVAEEKEIRIVYLGAATVARVKTSALAAVCVSHKTHLVPGSGR